MRIALVALLALGLLAVAVPTAAAHEEWCYSFDVDCRVECYRSHLKYVLDDRDHGCYTYIDP